ncbi:hypothetical protein [Nitratifractor salsuginis]|uniref:Uncharacterized protein n=1 Tax=Nitratifractor salsuginis (strain DSM 16511 / JCM 12458 / E9I37-1) TaxID=749222 RepID=E6X1N8_NITSE|nr:hypothetical protein [Nitratifractor salsuginis]ADV47029.1 hypothetical protein Nitsa_1784 [Nitratifractor salsuginis DSM 16511]
MINLRLLMYGVAATIIFAIAGRYMWLSHEVEEQRKNNEALKLDRDNSVISARAKAQIEAEDKRVRDEINRTIGDRVDYDRLW